MRTSLYKVLVKALVFVRQRFLPALAVFHAAPYIIKLDQVFAKMSAANVQYTTKYIPTSCLDRKLKDKQQTRSTSWSKVTGIKESMK